MTSYQCSIVTLGLGKIDVAKVRRTVIGKKKRRMRRTAFFAAERGG